ncbi:guanylate kinase [Kaarinaea lacus]
MTSKQQSSTTSGSLYVIAAPSGAGKTSLVKSLLECTENIAVSVSHTTRAPRPGEVDGTHYYFVDVSSFEKLRDTDQFLEHAKVFDNYYGTSRQSVDTLLKKGSDVILEIDWQGAQQTRQLYPECCGIFILPPSRKALEDRLRSRGQDDDAVIQRRMRDAIAEMSHYREFDYLVINDDFEEALATLKSIIIARRQRTTIQVHRQERLLQELLAEVD